jgi:hypothetical protein
MCSGYAYGDATAVTTMMSRLGLEGNACRLIGRYVDAMLIDTTAYVLQSGDGRVVIVCYRGTVPLSGLSWLNDLDLNPHRLPLFSARQVGPGRDGDRPNGRAVSGRAQLRWRASTHAGCDAAQPVAHAVVVDRAVLGLPQRRPGPATLTYLLTVVVNQSAVGVETAKPYRPSPKWPGQQAQCV